MKSIGALVVILAVILLFATIGSAVGEAGGIVFFSLIGLFVIFLNLVIKGLITKTLIFWTLIVILNVSCSTISSIVKNEDYYSNALTEAAIAGDLDKVEYAINSGADINFKREIWMEGKKTPIIFAWEKGHLKIVKYLIDKGANIDDKNKNGRTPLMLAIEGGNFNYLNYLAKNDADNNQSYHNEETPLTLDIQFEKEKFDVISYLVKKGANVNQEDYNGDTPLTIAINKGNIKIIKFLIESGANLNLRENSYYGTPLILAADLGNLEIVSYLVKKGANINEKGKYGYSALMVASQKGHIEIVKFLVNNGANIHLKNISGDTALKYATNNGKHDIVSYLENVKQPKIEILVTNNNGQPVKELFIKDKLGQYKRETMNLNVQLKIYDEDLKNAYLKIKTSLDDIDVISIEPKEIRLAPHQKSHNFLLKFYELSYESKLNFFVLYDGVHKNYLDTLVDYTITFNPIDNRFNINCYESKFPISMQELLNKAHSNFIGPFMTNLDILLDKAHSKINGPFNMVEVARYEVKFDETVFNTKRLLASRYYDEFGNLIEENIIVHGPYPYAPRKIKLNYNSEDVIESVIRYGYDGGLLSKTEYKYDDKRIKLINTEKTGIHREAPENSIFQYDNNNYLQSIKHTEYMNNKVSNQNVYRYKYDRLGRVVVIYHFNFRHIPIYRTEIVYDDTDYCKPIKIIVKNEIRGITDLITNIKYSGENIISFTTEIINTTHILGDNCRIYYDNYGNIIQIDYFYKANISHRVIYTYFNK